MLNSAIETEQWNHLHCSKDALTDFFGWMLQALLAGLAFTCLIGKIYNKIQFTKMSPANEVAVTFKSTFTLFLLVN